MNQASYIRRRGELRDYFDRTALDAWKRLTGTEQVSGIRATVRAGRDRMRAEMLSRLPDDLSGWRVLDAGCGAGQMAVELARRGADVIGIDLSPEMVEHATASLPPLDRGSVELASGDMLSPQWGEFDAVVAMDSLIHYSRADAVAALQQLARRTRRSIIFTLAPRTVPLTLMHLAGKLFPRGDRAPAIVPVSPGRLAGELLFAPDMADWHLGKTERVVSGFYISQCMEVARR